MDELKKMGKQELIDIVTLQNAQINKLKKKWPDTSKVGDGKLCPLSSAPCMQSKCQIYNTFCGDCNINPMVYNLYKLEIAISGLTKQMERR